MNFAMDDALYMLDARMRQFKHELNEARDDMLTEAELEALLDAYTEAGR